MNRIIFLFVAAALLAGCATDHKSTGTGKAITSEPDRTCVRTDLIRSFQALDDQHVVIRIRTSDFYLFSVTTPCSGLRHSRAIGLDGSQMRVCEDGFQWLTYERAGVGTDRCRIERIEAVDDFEAAEALAASRISEKAVDSEDSSE